VVHALIRAVPRAGPGSYRSVTSPSSHPASEVIVRRTLMKELIGRDLGLGAGR